MFHPVEVAKQVQLALATRNFRVYTASDVIGAELCGALKNVLAIACGASDGFGFGANARSALITRGLAEMTRLVVKKGGKASTITGLAGLSQPPRHRKDVLGVGDLVLTCSSSLSRNYSVGQAMASQSLPEHKCLGLSHRKGLYVELYRVSSCFKGLGGRVRWEEKQR